MQELAAFFEHLINMVKTLAIVFVCSAMFVFVGYVIYRKKIESMPKELELRLRGKEHGIIFGSWGPFVCCSPEEDEGHVFDYAGSGKGKTRSQVLQTLNKWKGPAFCIDLAGDIIPNTPNVNRVVYTPWDKYSMPYNVFYHVDFAESVEEQYDELDLIIQFIMPKTEFQSETTEYYYKIGKKIITASFYAFYFQRVDFVDICKKIYYSTWEELFAQIKRSNNYEAIKIIEHLESEKESNVGSGKERANEEIDLYARKSILTRTLRRPERYEKYISPKSLESVSLYVNITEKYNILYKPLMQLITNQCIHYILNRKNYTGKTILMCLDEYSSLGYIDLQEPLDKFRKKGCRLYVHLQSILQLDNMYSTTQREAMMENVKFQIIMGSNVPRIQKLYADIIGTKNDEDDTYIIKPDKIGKLKKHVYVRCPSGAIKLRKKFV